jgi:hypothetical protein
MWSSRRAPADWVTLIASRVVAAASNATASRALLRSLRCQRIQASCTTSSASAALSEDAIGDTEGHGRTASNDVVCASESLGVHAHVVARCDSTATSCRFM